MVSVILGIVAGSPGPHQPCSMENVKFEAAERSYDGLSGINGRKSLHHPSCLNYMIEFKLSLLAN